MLLKEKSNAYRNIYKTQWKMRRGVMEKGKSEDKL
jgi:hypothetical protein